MKFKPAWLAKLAAISNLGSDSPLIIQHHSNWRMQAIASLDPNNQEDLHYSAVVSIRAEDFEKIKTQLIKSVEDARKNWNEAHNEDQLCVMALDWFKLSE